MMNRFKDSASLRAYGALLCVYIAWGTTLAANHIGLESLSPIALNFQRFLLVGVILMGFCLLQGEPWPEWSAWKRNAATGFFLFITGNTLSVWTLQYLPTGLAAALFALNPFWMVGLTFLLPPRESVTMSDIIGLLMGFAGMIITLWPKIILPLQEWSPMFWWSIAALMGVSISWSYGSIFFRKSQGASSLLMSVAIQNLVAGLMLLPVALLFHDNPFAMGFLNSHMAVFYLIVVGSFIGQSCYLYTVEHLPVAVSSTYSYVTPVVTMIVGWLFLNEEMTPYMLVGMTIILLGVSLVQRKNTAYRPRIQTNTTLKQGG